MLWPGSKSEIISIILMPANGWHMLLQVKQCGKHSSWQKFFKSWSLVIQNLFALNKNSAPLSIATDIFAREVEIISGISQVKEEGNTFPSSFTFLFAWPWFGYHYARIKTLTGGMIFRGTRIELRTVPTVSMMSFIRLVVILGRHVKAIPLTYNLDEGEAKEDGGKRDAEWA